MVTIGNLYRTTFYLCLVFSKREEPPVASGSFVTQHDEEGSAMVQSRPRWLPSAI